MSIVPRLDQQRKLDAKSTHLFWDSNQKPTERSYVYKRHVDPEAILGGQETFYDRTPNDPERADDAYIDPLTSVLEARRQNAFFKQREIERLQNESNDINARIRFERGNYEQWARSPVRRSNNNSVLYRGIQQLKARIVKDDPEKVGEPKISFSQSVVSKESINKPFESQTLEQSVLQPHSGILRRQRTADSGFSRYSSYGRSPLKVSNAVVHVLSERSEKQESHHSHERQIGSSRSLDHGKPRVGTLKFKDRVLFPLSYTAPKCVEENALLINKPIRSSEIYRQKFKLGLKEIDLKQRHKSDYRLKPLDSKTKLNESSEESGDETNAQGQRSISYFGSFAPRKLLATIRVAELYDYSQMGHHPHPPTELRYLERQLTDPTIRGSKVIKWVPNLQHMKEKN